MALTLDKKCFLCNVKEINGNCLVDSQESSLILCKVLKVPHLMDALKKLESINYCHPCKERILKIYESLEFLKKLEKEVLEEKYLLELQLKTNYRLIGDEISSPWNFGVELVNEMSFKSIKSVLNKVAKNQIDRKFCLKTGKYRIMKNITIAKKLNHGMFEKHISKETTPLIYSIISTEIKPFINDNLSHPSNGDFVDSSTNSQFSHAELHLTSHVYNFDEIKLELLSRETNNTTDNMDPCEGIVPESDFITENSTTQKTFICGTCETNFDNYSQMDEHCHTHTDSKSFCPSEFVPKVTNSCVDIKSLLKCKYCVEAFPDRFRVRRHELHHTQEKPFTCSYSEKYFLLPHSVKMHKSIHTEGKSFKSGYCDETFRDSNNMKPHERIHTAVKHFNCKFCEKSFTRKANMVRHELIHVAVEHFKCKFCEKCFTNKGSMVQHERIHTKEKPFKCSYCEKSFFSSYYLKIHERIHTGEKPLKCGYCEKTFGDPANTRKHERIHTGEKPFKCSYCEKTFRDRGKTKTHECIHTGEKPFKCGYCDKTFRYRHFMKSHERTHT